MLQVTLNKYNEKGELVNQQTYMPAFIKGRLFRKTVEMSTLNTSSLTAEFSDTMVTYICDVFNNQFTMDEFYDGMDARKILPTFTNCIKEIMNSMEQAVGTPNPNA